MSASIIINKVRRIKLLILDVDGVLTDGRIWITPDGQEAKFFHTHDGLGIKLLQKAGINVAVISGRSSPVVNLRMKELGIDHIYQGQTSKITAFEELINHFNLTAEAIAYMGDDIIDLPVMKQVGLSIAVANAVSDVKSQADWLTQKTGGQGAVREVCDLILNVHANHSKDFSQSLP